MAVILTGGEQKYHNYHLTSHYTGFRKQRGPVNATLVRQAKLGASCRVPCYTAGSPCRAKPSQQPVPSVARLAELITANKSREAYTGNTVGRRGDVPPLSNSASSEYSAVGDDFNVSEARTKESSWQDSGGTAGVIERGMQ
ncbi:hypothetical protein [Desulforhopalus sp. 52FAK]